MWAVIKATLLQVWKELLVYGAIAGVIALVVLKLRDSGRQAEQNESLKKTIKVVRERDEIRNTVAGSDDAEYQRLRDKWTERN